MVSMNHTLLSGSIRNVRTVQGFGFTSTLHLESWQHYIQKRGSLWNKPCEELIQSPLMLTNFSTSRTIAEFFLLVPDPRNNLQMSAEIPVLHIFLLPRSLPPPKNPISAANGVTMKQ